MGRTSDARPRLIDAMARLAHRRGYGEVGVEDVCREAGVKKGSFYHFFPSKRALMLAALERHWETMAGLMQSAFDPRQPPLQRFSALAKGMANAEAANHAGEGRVLGCPFGKLAAEIGRDEGELSARIDAAFRQYSKAFAATLTEAQSKGDLPSSVDVAATADAMMAYVQGVLLVAKMRNDPTILATLLPRGLGLAVVSPPLPRRRTPRRRA